MTDAFEPEVVVLYCLNSVGGKAGLANSIRKVPGGKARFVLMPCSSKVEVGELVKLFESGVDAVLVVGCPERLCRFLVGNTKAEMKVKKVRQFLEELGYGAERAAMIRKNGLGSEDLIQMAAERAAAVRELGPNPMKKDENKPRTAAAGK